MAEMISIVVPAFNEESRIAQAVYDLKKISFAVCGFKKEIIVINDGSTDKTGEILKKVKGITLISYKKNMGKGYALRKGFGAARGSVVAVQDADLEYDPKDIVLLLGEILKGSDVVFGSRFLGNPKEMSFIFFFGNKVLSTLTTLLFGQRITDMETCQKVFKKKRA